MAASARPTAEWLCPPRQGLFHIFPPGPMCSLRRALLLWLVPLFLLVGAGSAVVSYWTSSRMVDSLLDGQMRQFGETLAASHILAAALPRTDEPVDASGTYVVQVYDAHGRLLESPPEALPAVLPARPGFEDVRLRGRDWRVYTSRGGSEGRRVQVFQSAEFRRRQAAERAVAAIAPVVILLPLAILVLWGVARAMSGAMQEIGRRAALQDANTISELPLERVPQEIQPLVTSFNSLLTRLRDAFADQRQFLLDAAHELRTPITALALQMENVRDDLPAGACAQSFAQLEAGLKRAQRLVEQLLKLSRQQSPFVERPVALDLRMQLRESISALIAVADQRHIDLGLEDLAVPDTTPTWRCAPGDLRSVLDNLVENALRYTPEGGVVDVRLLGDDTGAIVEVADTGPGIPDDLLGRVFDRFYRVPGASMPGSGLGLAIAQAAARRCGLRVTLRNRTDRSGLLARISRDEPDAVASPAHVRESARAPA